MKQICLNDSRRDLMSFVPGLSTDLRSALKSGQVLGGDVAPSYNGIDDPSEIHGRVRDAFDAVEAFDRLNRSAVQSTPSGASE